jgi:tRNA U54 and U55 pseudouridine synthase Pus10
VGVTPPGAETTNTKSPDLFILVRFCHISFNTEAKNVFYTKQYRKGVKKDIIEK